MKRNELIQNIREQRNNPYASIEKNKKERKISRLFKWLPENTVYYLWISLSFFYGLVMYYNEPSKYSLLPDYLPSFIHALVWASLIAFLWGMFGFVLLMTITIMICIIFSSFIEPIFRPLSRRLKERKVRKISCPHKIPGGITRWKCNLCREIWDESEKERENEQLEVLKRQGIDSKRRETWSSELKRLRSALLLSTKSKLTELSANKFEDLIAKLYKRLGFSVRQTPYVGDQGKDIVATKDGKTFVIECKKYSGNNPISRPMLQKLNSAKHEENADKAIFVTTAFFTGPSTEYAKRYGMTLIDGNELVFLLNRTFPELVTSLNKIEVVCPECGEMVAFNINNNERMNRCPNGHTVKNDVTIQKLINGVYFCNQCGSELPASSKNDEKCSKHSSHD